MKDTTENEPVTVTDPAEVTDPKGPETTEPTPDPVATELARVKKEPKTEAEKAAFSLKKNAERAAALGVDVKTILGLSETSDPSDDDNQPVTVGMLKKIKEEEGTKTSIDLAQAITDEHERELAIHYLETRIKPSGNPQEDLKMARALVNSVKNTQIIEESQRKTAPRTTTTGSGAPGRHEAPVELTAHERAYTLPPWNLTPEEVVKTRPKL